MFQGVPKSVTLVAGTPPLYPTTHPGLADGERAAAGLEHLDHVREVPRAEAWRTKTEHGGLHKRGEKRGSECHYTVCQLCNYVRNTSDPLKMM